MTLKKFNFNTTHCSIGDNTLYAWSKCVAALLPFSKINDLELLKVNSTKFIFSNIFYKLLGERDIIYFLLENLFQPTITTAHIQLIKM